MPAKGTRDGVTVPCARCDGRVYLLPSRRVSARFCSRACFYADRRQPMEARFRLRFDGMVKGDGCWLWPGTHTVDGYGTIRKGGKHEGSEYVHRLAWWLATGYMPTTDEDVCHHCPDGDSPGCIRNDEVGTHEVQGVIYPRRGHLWLGDQASNIADMIAKGRAPDPRLRSRANVPRGASHQWAKLSDAKVIAILAEVEAGGRSQREIARAFGISQQMVSRLALGQRRRALLTG